MSNPLVSIIIPVYNGSNFLREAVDSALAQTYQNCEIIVVNDGSTDDTEEICKSYGDKIRYYAKENGGVSTALNFGIKVMHGEYFSWLSHDDLYYPDKIETQIEALRKDGDMTKIVFGDFEVLNQETGVRSGHILINHATPEKLTHSVYPVLRHMTSGCVLLIHKSHFARVGLFDESMRYVQDYDMWFRIFRNMRTVYINRVLQTVRIHGAELSIKDSEPMKLEEGAFWSEIAAKLTVDEIKHIYGSVLVFLLETCNLLAACDYVNETIETRLKREISKKPAKEIIHAITGKAPTYIFGAGTYGTLFCRFLLQCGISVCGFIDNDKSKHGMKIVGEIECVPFEAALKNKNNVFLFIALSKNSEVVAQVQESAFPHFITIQHFYRLLAEEA